MKKLLISAVLALTACGSLQESYVKQDRKNFETLAPRIRTMMAKSDVYTPAQEADIEDRLQAWEAWTDAALKTIEEEKKK